MRSEGPAILESEREAVIRMLEEGKEYRKIVEDVSGGSYIEVERKMQHWVTALQERAEVDKGQMRVMECGLRWAVENQPPLGSQPIPQGEPLDDKSTPE